MRIAEDRRAKEVIANGIRGKGEKWGGKEGPKGCRKEERRRGQQTKEEGV